MPSLLETRRARFTELTDRVRALTDEIAAQEDATATDEQAANLDTMNDELARLVPQIEHARSIEDRMTQGAALLAGAPSNVGAQLDAARAVNREISEYATWGEYARALAEGAVPDATADAIDRAVLDLERAQRARTTGDYARVLADVTTAQVPGILPPQWLTDIVDFIGQARPFVSAFSTNPLPPSGMTVSFPSVTVKPLTGKQATEKTDIPSQATNIVAGNAAVQTYGGGEDVSVQVIQRTDPAYLAIVNELYAEDLAMKMDAAAINIATAAVPAGNVVPLGAAATGYNAALAAGAKVIAANRATFDTLVVGLDIWAAFLGAADPDGRPLFPNLSPMNPVGAASVTSLSGNARGLTFVADPNMPAAVAIGGWSRAFTSMLGGVQTLRADNPSKLGVDFAVYEFAAFAVRRAGALVKFTLP